MAAARSNAMDHMVVVLFENHSLDSMLGRLTMLSEKEHRPGLFHCTTGKDRTGWAAASLRWLLGVSDEDVLDDYLLTNESLVPALQPMVDKFASIGGDPQLPPLTFTAGGISIYQLGNNGTAARHLKSWSAT